MRRNIPRKSSRFDRRCRGALRMLAGEQSGFSIVEVVVAALMLTLLSGAVATALISTARFSGDERKRSQATEIAQQDQERLRGLSIKALSGLDQTQTYGPYDGTTYSVRSQGQFLSNTGSASCSTSGNGAAAFVLITSTVNWADNRRPAVVQRSVITPNAGGTLLVNAIDQNSAPLPGVAVTIYGKETEDAVTGTEGCAIFGSLTVSGYYVFAAKSGFVDVNGNDNPVGGANVLATGTSYPSPNPFQLGQAGAVQASFSANNGALTNQQAPSLSAYNAGRNSPLVTTPASPATTITSTKTLFPFNNGTSGVYTDNYTVWAGKCLAERPPAASRVAMTVGPGLTPTTPVVKEPAMKVTVQYPSGTNVKPAAIRLTYAQTAPTTCSEGWDAPLNTAAGPTPPANGWLASPGQPFAGSYTENATTYTGSYTVCASYDTNGAAAGGVRWGAVQNQSNSNFASITTVPAIVISNTDSPGTSGPNSCPVL